MRSFWLIFVKFFKCAICSRFLVSNLAASASLFG